MIETLRPAGAVGADYAGGIYHVLPGHGDPDSGDVKENSLPNINGNLKGGHAKKCRQPAQPRYMSLFTR